MNENEGAGVQGSAEPAAPEKPKAWFQTGYKDIPKGGGDFDSDRFFLKKGESTVVTMLTDEPFGIYEHQIETADKWNNYVTCTAGMGKCLGCEHKIKRQFVGFYTVIHETQFETKKGIVKNPKKLLPVSPKQLKLFGNWKEKRGTLISAQYDVTRTEEQTSYRIGDDWQVKNALSDRNDDGSVRTMAQMLAIAAIRLARMYPGDDVPKKDITLDNLPERLRPHNYQEVLAPKSDDEVKELIGKAKKSEDVKTAVGGEEDIPF